MRILVVQESDWIKRNPVQQHHMLERLSRDGHEVLVIDYPIRWRDEGSGLIAPRRVHRNVSRVVPDAQVTVVRTAMLRIPVVGKLTWLVTNTLEIARAFRTFRPDVLVVLGLSNSLVASRMARAAGVPVVVHLIDALHTLVEPELLRPVAARVEREVLRGADRVVAINKALAAYAERMGAQPERIEVIPTGADTERFGPQVDGSAVRAEYGLSPEDTVMVFVGWLYIFAGLKELAEEMAAEANPDPRLRLMVVGDGDLIPVLRQLRDTYLGDRLILTGAQPVGRMPEFLAAADICLLPAQVNDTMQHIVPAKVYEYLAAGKPVLASPLPGLIRELGDEAGTQYVDDSRSLLSTATRLQQDQRETARRGTQARSVAARGGNWESVTERFHRVLGRATCDDRPQAQAVAAE